MGKRGSETCPIDLTKDESPSKKKTKREHASITQEELRSLTLRLQSLEEKLASAQQEKESRIKLLTKNEGFDEFIVKFNNLENRLESLESCLERLAQAFSIFRDPAGVVASTKELNRSHESVDSLTYGHCESAEVQDPESNDNTLSESSSIASSKHVPHSKISTRSEVPNPIVHVKGPLKKQNSTNHANIGHSENLNVPVPGSHRRCEGCLGCDSCTSGCLSAAGDPITANVIEDEEPVDGNSLDDDTGFEPERPFIKQEIDLQRDDQGRILMTLCSSAKKLNKISPNIVAVAGLYLTDQVHNEFIFESDRGMKDVKLEAEIRAALFGLETVKTLFSGSLNEVCVMIISSSQYFVQQMKAGRVYPNFYLCSCEHRDCEHSERRWASEESLGKTQISVLPDLMIASQSIRVHWCKTDQLSPEEQRAVNSYKSGVDTLLDVHVRLKRNQKNGTTPN